MTMSTHVMGIKPADETYKRMLAAYEACTAAVVPVPAEVQKFFDFEKPEPTGVSVNLDKDGAVRKWEGEAASGFEVDLGQLDPTIRVLRFYNAW